MEKKLLRRERTRRKSGVLPLFYVSITLCILGVLSPTTLRAQAQQRITLDMKQATIEQAIIRIKETTRYKFTYLKEDMPATPLRDYKFNGSAIDQVMNTLLTGTVLQWAHVDGTIVISNKLQQRPEQSTRTVTGLVTGDDGLPLIGATITLKHNPTRGTVTDVTGSYRLAVTGVSPTLVVSFIGYTPREIEVKEANVYNVTLMPGAQKIQEVTVSTGYQEIPKERVTGSTYTLTAKELENSNFMSLDQALEGKVPGLYSITPSGAPGTRANIRIRGDNTLSGNLEPLWVVDGLPMQQGVESIKSVTQGSIQESILDHGVGNLMPGDIESVTILKDAAATAIYGARAANGVIVVKTKKGSQGPVSVSYQGNFSISQPLTNIDLDFMNAREKVDYEIELIDEFGSWDRAGAAGRLHAAYIRNMVSAEDYNAQLEQWRNVNENWFKQLYRSSLSHKHNVSIRGGSDNVWYYGSVNVTKEKGALKTNEMTSFGASTTVGFKIREKLTANMSLDARYRESKDHNSAINPFQYAVFANPYEKAYNANGTYAWDTSFLGSNLGSLGEELKFPQFNILNEMYNTMNKQRAADMTASLSLVWDINSDFKAEGHARVGYSVLNGEQYADQGTYASYVNYFSTDPLGGQLPLEYNRGYLRKSSGYSPSYSLRASLSYNKTFHDTHIVTAYLGTETASKESWNDTFRTAEYDALYQFVGFPQFAWNPGFSEALQRAIGDMSKSVYGNKDRTLSMFGALTYSYKDRYVVNGNVRFDGASTIDPDNRFTPLWSASFRWNAHREKFIAENLPFLSEFGVRAVYGYTGNIDKAALPFSYILLSSTRYDNEYMAGTTNFPNPSIKWERKLDRSVGVDFAVFDNMFGGSFNYYNNLTSDILGTSMVPDSYGNSKVVMNTHSVKNTGWELNFNLRLRFGEDWRWTTYFNVSHNNSSIHNSNVKDPLDFKEYLNGNVSEWGFHGNVEGYKPGSYFGYRYAGASPTTGNAMVYLSEESRKIYAEAKGIALEDAPRAWDVMVNPDIPGYDIGSFIRRSMQVIGCSQPDYYGGFGTTLAWKNLDIRMTFNYTTGHLLRTFDETSYGYKTGSNSELYSARLNRLRSAQDRWRSPGDITDVPRYSTESTRYTFLQTDDKFEKGDYIQLSDISLNYNLRGDWMKNIGVQYMRVGLQVSNVHTFTKYSGLDVTTGDAFGYPRQRMYLLNLQLTF